MFSSVSKTPMHERTVGVIAHVEEKTQNGVTLISVGRETYLLDMDGRVVHEWRSDRMVFCAYLKSDGTLIRDGNDAWTTDSFGAGGAAGLIEAVTWNNERLWSFQCRPYHHFLSHHDIEIMPNGNILLMVWERKSKELAIAAGRSPHLIPDNEVWENLILELRPNDHGSAEIVWSWGFWDHLVQDFDPTKANYGDVAKSPDRFDINLCPLGGKKQGRGAAPNAPKVGKTGESDWTHCNSVSYDPVKDRIAISLNAHSEIILIDHSKANRGIVWRYGNPMNYRAGCRMEQKLFCQHAAQFIDGGRRIICFNNGRRPDRWWSSVDIIEITGELSIAKVSPVPLRDVSSTSLMPLANAPRTSDRIKTVAKIAAMKARRGGGYNRKVSKAKDASLPVAPPSNATSLVASAKRTFARDWSTASPMGKLVWSYGPERNRDGSWYSTHISSCHSLPNGNTLITQGPQGRVIEVTAEGKEVWRWVNPICRLSSGENGAISFVRQRDQRPDNGSWGLFQAWRYTSDFFSKELLRRDPVLAATMQETQRKPRASMQFDPRRYLEPYP